MTPLNTGTGGKKYDPKEGNLRMKDRRMPKADRRQDGKFRTDATPEAGDRRELNRRNNVDRRVESDEPDNELTPPSSVSHGSNNKAHGNYWRRPDEKPNPPIKTKSQE